MKPHLFPAVAATVLGLSCPASWSMGDASCKDVSDMQAIEALRVKVRSERLYSSWAKEQCLSFYPEHCDNAVVELAIRELHSDQCGGDPNTGPVVDRFRVFKQSSRIDWFDPVAAEYVEFDKVHTNGKR
ncbi:hypothetical protein SNE35_10370 [Paucibacter sp. R3-3]|uniref:Uncharacterized protein n=1 Tax=Roseateles agri TaxID=3098619 RepID=A0ABU5DI74_9BURK|nr:hypothetical protein [Paucibacter sp. R3-3]MDY0744914.1 hypothetical protein [Paucibacter sp. R3-3]